MKTITILVLSVLILSGCSGDLVETNVKEINSGTYQLKGVQIEKRLCFARNVCENGEVLSADTTEIEFNIGIEYLSGITDSLRFRNLQGADTGEYRVTERGKSYAKLNGVNLTFDIEEPGGQYFGSGYIGAGKMSLNTKYYYRTVEIEYNLTGEKIDNEVLR